MRLIVLLAALVGLSAAAGKERLFKLKPRLSGQNARSINIISINMISITYTLQDVHSIIIIISIIMISNTCISISITYTLQDVVSRVVPSLSLV